MHLGINGTYVGGKEVRTYCMNLSLFMVRGPVWNPIYVVGKVTMPSTKQPGRLIIRGDLPQIWTIILLQIF